MDHLKLSSKERNRPLNLTATSALEERIVRGSPIPSRSIRQSPTLLAWKRRRGWMEVPGHTRRAEGRIDGQREREKRGDGRQWQKERRKAVLTTRLPLYQVQRKRHLPCRGFLHLCKNCTSTDLPGKDACMLFPSLGVYFCPKSLSDGADELKHTAE